MLQEFVSVQQTQPLREDKVLRSLPARLKLQALIILSCSLSYIDPSPN